MPHNALPFQYQAEKNDSGLTGFAGLPLYLELAVNSGLIEYINQTIKTKIRGWTDAEMILSLILLNLAGGDCISDIERLEQDAGFRTLLIQFATHGMKRIERREKQKVVAYLPMLRFIVTCLNFIHLKKRKIVSRVRRSFPNQMKS